jgi:CBS-domain-containing membrane protein
MRVRDIMTRQVCSLQTTDTIERAAAMLADRKITAAPVLDAAGRLVGMVSEGDLLWHRVPPDPTAHVRRGIDGTDRPKLVRDVMSRDPVTAWPEADLSDVAQLMLRHGVRSLPILHDGRIVGIVSRRDVLRTVVRGDDVLHYEVQHRLDEYADGERRWAVTVIDGVATIDGTFADESERTIVTVIARTVPGVAAVRTLQPAG